MKPMPASLLVLILLLPASIRAQTGEDAKMWKHVIGYSGGTGYSDDKEVRLVFPESSRLVSIRVRARQVVEAIEFTFDDGTGNQQTKLVGSAGNESAWQARFVIPPNVRLVGVSGTREVAVDSLRFHLSDGTESPEYGGRGGYVAFSFGLAKRDGEHLGRVTGFFGRAGSVLIGAGLLYDVN